MAVSDLLAVLRTRREKRVLGIEDTAARLAKGETISPEEVEAILDRCGATPEQLMEAVEMHERRVELRAAASGEQKAVADLGAIDRKRVLIATQLQTAEERLRSFDAGYAAEVSRLEEIIRQARAAHAALLADRNLRPEALAALTDARDKYAAVSQAATAASEAVDEAKRRHDEAVAQLAHNESVGVRHMPEHVEQVQRDRTAAETRGKRVKEAEAMLVAARQAAEAARVALRQAEERARQS
jgi:hypothetical protein